MAPYKQFLIFFFLSISIALQTSKDSPCESLCDTDPSCTASEEFTKCMTCLQHSTFGNDQAHFRENVRFSFDYCIFGYNSTEGSNPCATSEACGPLKSSFTSFKNDNDFGYCNHSLTDCMACIDADPRKFLSNYLVVLNASCVDRSTSHQLNLNDTIFASHTITLLDPAPPPAPKQILSTPVIIAIAISGFILICLVTGCIYLQRRKRKNRLRKGRVSSSFDFRCQANLDSSEMYQRDDQIYFDNFSPLQAHPTDAIGIASTTNKAEEAGLALDISVPTAPAPVAYSPYSASPATSTTEFFPRKASYSTIPKTASPVVKQSAWMRTPRTTGSPVESRQIQISFPPPPKR